MIRMPLLLPLLLLALLPVAASAASPGKACDDARTQLDINECAAREADASDAELNAERMYDTAERLCMPPFPKDRFVEAVKEVVRAI